THAELKTLIDLTIEKTTASMIRDVINPLADLTKRALAGNEELRGHLHNSLQDSQTERYTNHEELSRLICQQSSRVETRVQKLAEVVSQKPSFSHYYPSSTHHRRPMASSLPPPRYRSPEISATPSFSTTTTSSSSSSGVAAKYGLDTHSPVDNLCDPLVGFLDCANWTAFGIDAASLPFIALRWSLRVENMSTHHKCPVCEMFKDTSPAGLPIIYLFNDMKSDAVAHIFSKKAHRGRTCPFVTLLKREIGDEVITL